MPSAAFWIALLEFIGALMVMAYLGRAWFVLLLVPCQRIEQARYWIAEGVMMGLSFKLCASLLKILTVHSWKEILIFLVIVCLRTFLKQYFQWEKRHLIFNAEGLPS